MGGYKIIVTVQDDQHNRLLQAEYFTTDGYETGDAIEREVAQAIEEHLQDAFRDIQEGELDGRSLWQGEQGQSNETTQPAY